MSEELWKRIPNWLLGIGLLAVAAVVLFQMIRGDALICENGAVFATTCPPPSPRPPSTEIPEGIIVMTDRECAALGSNWKLYTPAAGRFPVAAGEAMDDRNERKSFSLGQKGGEYLHQLSEEELPRLIQAGSQSYRSRCGGDCRRIANSGAIGSNEPHNNIPPYLVFNFCHAPRQ